MFKLNLPNYKVKVKKENNTHFILDSVRKKYLQLTPEEYVRQQVVLYLHKELKYPLGRFSIEKQFKLLKTIKRIDIVIYDKQGKPFILVECKAPYIEVDESTFLQASAYNIEIQAPYIFLTNGLNHLYYAYDKETNIYKSLEKLPFLEGKE